MISVDKLQDAQEQRLKSALDCWNDAKKNLETAIALAEAREKDYHKVAEDVRLKMDALQVVISMADALENETAPRSVSDGTALRAERTALEPVRAITDAANGSSRPTDDQRATANPPAQSGLVRTSSRRLFPANWRSADYNSTSLHLK